MSTRITYHPGDRAGRIGPAHPTDPQKFRNNASFSTHSSSSPYAPNTLGDFQQKLKGFFGMPNTRNQGTGYYEHELHTFPENYTEAFTQSGWGGKDMYSTQHNSHLSQVMLEKTAYSRCWPLFISPWAAEESSGITQTYHSVNFTQHIMDRLPELAIPRLLSRTETSGSVSLSRYGIAQILEQTFFETEKGKRTFALQLDQMTISVVTTACIAILVTLLTHDPWKGQDGDGEVDEESSTSAAGIDRLLSEEKAMTAIMNKGRGADLLIGKLKGRLARRGVGVGNCTLLPEGSERCFGSDSPSKPYLVLEETDEAIERAVNASHTIIKSSPFSMGHGSQAYDPVFRLRAYGVYNYLGSKHLITIKPEQYRTSCMNKMIYDRDGDSMRCAEYAAYYNKGGHYRWKHPKAPLASKPSEIGRGWASDLGVYTWGQTIRKHMSSWAQTLFYDVLDLRCKNNLQLQQEFLNSLSILPKNAPQLHCENGMYPTGGEFTRAKLLSMCEPNAAFDTVPTVADYQEALRNGGRTKPTVRGQAVKRTLEEMARQDTDLNAKELFELNEGEEEMQMDAPDEYVRQGDMVMRKNGVRTHARTVRRQYRAPRPSPNDGQAVVRKALDDMHTQLSTASETAEYTGVWLEAIAEARGYPDDVKFARYNALRACIVGARAFVDRGGVGFPSAGANPVEYKQWVVAVVDHLMNRIASTYDVQAALNNLSGHVTEQTLIEQKSIEMGFAVSRPNNEERANLKWDANATKEEGQISLMGRFPISYNTRPLPADAFAATLSSQGQVALLQSENMGDTLLTKLQRDFGPSARASRKTALQWSIVISHLFARMLDPKTGHFKEKTEADVKSVIETQLAALTEELQKRLLEYSIRVGSNWSVPLSQAPFHPVLSSLCAAVTEHLRAKASVPSPARGAAPAAPVASVLFTSSVQAILANLTELLPEDKFRVNVATLEPSTVDAVAKLAKKNVHVEDAEQVMSVASFQWNDYTVRDAIDRASVAFGGLWRFCVERDIPVPYDLGILRPNGVYRMGSAVHAQVGASDGAMETRWMKPHFATGADPGAKIMFGHFTAYMAPVMMRNDRVVVAPDVYINRYLRGHGMTVNDPNEETHKAAWSQGKGASIFVIAVPQVDCNKRSHSWMTITGRLPSSLPADNDVNEMMLYPGCQAFANFWGFHGSSINTYSKTAPYDHNPKSRELVQNTMCFQDLEIGWSPTTETWSVYTLHEGHFGKYSCYPGAKDVLEGRRPHFEEKPAYYNASAGVAG